MIKLVSVDSLIPHPRNEYFFDDMSGDNWDAFVESVRERGVITPITITKDPKSDYYIIVSGHQRVRACQKLGIAEIKAEIKEYATEDEILLDLIYTNIRQRGNGNPNQVKLGRCIKELERIHGIQHGNNQHGERIGNGFQSSLTQEELAKELGITQRTLHNYKKLAETIPELQELIMDGKISPKAAISLTKRLSQDEQLELIQSLDATKKYTAKEIDNAVAEYKEQIEADREKYNNAVKKRDEKFNAERSQLTAEISQLNKEVDDLRAHPVKPADYDSTRKRMAMLNSENYELKDKIKRLQSEVDAYNGEAARFTKNSEEYKKLERKLEEKKRELAQLEVENAAQFEIAKLCVVARDFVENKLAPVKFKKCFKTVGSNAVTYNDLVEVVTMIENWCSEMRGVLNNVDRVNSMGPSNVIDADYTDLNNTHMETGYVVDVEYKEVGDTMLSDAVDPDENISPLSWEEEGVYN